MEKPNQMIRREDGFAGFEDADDMPGRSMKLFNRLTLR
jgi:hypothetical protein